MTTIRFAEKNWRPDESTLVHTGDYRVPQDMSEDLAQRALEEGAAVAVDEPSDPPQGETEEAQPRRGRQRRSEA